MTTLSIEISPNSTKFALLCEFVKKQHTASQAAYAAGVNTNDYTRRVRELVSIGYLEPTGRLINGRKVFRVTPEGRTVCRRLKRLASKG